MRLIVFIFILNFPTSIYAQNWSKFSETPEVEFYVDLSSIKKNGSLVTYWSMYNKKIAALMNNPSNSYSTKLRVTQNCELEESKITYFASYENSMGEGKITESQSWDGKPTPNIPGSIGYIVMKYVCNSNRNSK
jgi:hypothetical protein